MEEIHLKISDGYKKVLAIHLIHEISKLIINEIENLPTYINFEEINPIKILDSGEINIEEIKENIMKETINILNPEEY